MLISDIIKQICTYLSDSDINYFLSASKQLYKLKNHVQFIDKHILTEKINMLPYYDNFVNLIINDDKYYTFPKNLKKIFFKVINVYLLSLMPLSVTSVKINNFIWSNIKKITLPNIKKLVISVHKFDRNINPNDIPPSVTHLNINGEQIFALKSNCIPPNVVYLNIDCVFEQNIPTSVKYLKTNRICYNENIPSSISVLEIDTYYDSYKRFHNITHLIFSLVHDCKFSKMLPTNFTHITFKKSHLTPFSKILSSSVTHLILSDSFDKDIINTVPQTVKFLTIKKFKN